MGNLPAAVDVSARNRPLRKHRHTLGETGTQETRNLLDQSVGSDEGIVLAGELLDQLLVLVELLQVIGGHGINTTVLGTIDIMLVTENAIPSSQPGPYPSMCARMTYQMLIPGRGTTGRRTVPEKRLSRWGS